MYFFYSVFFKPHANPTVINENIKEIHILVVGCFPEISHFKSCASPPCRSMSVSEDLRAMTVIMQLIGENRGVTFSRRILVISSRGVSKLPII